MNSDITNKINKHIESCLNKEDYELRYLDEDTFVIDFTDIELTNEDGELERVTPLIEYWIDEDKWKYVLLFEDDTVPFELDKDLLVRVKKLYENN